MSSSLIKLLIVVVTLCLLQVTASAQDCMGPTFQNMACVGRIRNTYNNVNMATCDQDCCSDTSCFAVNLDLTSGGQLGTCTTLDGCSNMVSAPNTNTAKRNGNSAIVAGSNNARRNASRQNKLFNVIKEAQ